MTESKVCNSTVYLSLSSKFLTAFNTDNIFSTVKTKRLKKAAKENSLLNKLFISDYKKLQKILSNMFIYFA